MISACTDGAVWTWSFNIVLEEMPQRRGSWGTLWSLFSHVLQMLLQNFDSLHFRVQVSIQNLLVFFGSYFSPCLSCPYQAGVEFSLWVVLEGSAISWWSSLVTSFTGSCPLGGIDANCVVCEFSMQMVRSNKLEFREILYSLHTLVLNCGKWNNVPVSAWWELIENVATTASFQL